MKRFIIFFILIVFNCLTANTIVMEDKQEFKGNILGKFNQNLYVYNDEGNLNELPISKIETVLEHKFDVTTKWLDKDDFQDFKFGDWRYPIVKYKEKNPQPCEAKIYNHETINGNWVGYQNSILYITNSKDLHLIDYHDLIEFSINNEKRSLSKIDFDNFLLINESDYVVINHPIHKKMSSNIKKYYKYPNLRMLPLTFLCIFISSDYFADANDLQDQIDRIENDELDLNTSKLENKKHRKQLIATSSLIIGAINAYISLGRIEITTNGNDITFNYHF